MKTKILADHSKFWLGDDFNTQKFDASSTMALLKLSAYRRAIGNFVYILTGKNIPVRFAENSTSMTDGKVIYIGGELTKGEFDPTVGLSLHEAMHIVKSDFDLIKTMWGKIPRSLTAAAKGHFDQNYIGNLAKYILNVVEDRYIDACAYESAPGYRGYYQALYDRYFNLLEIGEALKSDAYRNATVKNYKFRFTNITNVNNDLDALPALRKISELLDLNNILRTELENPKNRLELAYQITEEILKSVVEEKENPKQQDKNKDNQDKQSGGDEQSDDKSEQSDSNDDVDDVLGGTPSSANPIQDDADETPDENPSKDLSNAEKKKVDKLIEKQEQIVTREVKQSAFDKDTIKKLQILEQSSVDIVQVGDETVPKVDCIVVKNMTRELMMTSEFPYTSKFSRETGNPASSRGVQQGIIIGTMLGRKLQIRSEVKTTKFTRLQKGKIDKRLLASIGFQGENLFYQTTTDKYKNAHLHVTVDASSSMETKWEKTMTTLVAIAKAVSMINNVTLSISFRSGVSKDRGGYETPYIVLAYDSRKDKFNKIVQLFPLLFPHGSTPEGLAFQAIIKHIPASTHEMDSYFVNLSDGEPAFGASYYGNVAAEHTKKQINKIREIGVSVLSYFVECNNTNSKLSDKNSNLFRTMYGKDAQFIDVQNVVQIAHTLNKMFLSKES
jgi:hypothetical protein